MGKRLSNISKEEVLAAIDGSMGVIEDVRKKLHVGWDSAKKLIYSWKETEEAFEKGDDSLLDLSRGVLADSVKAGNVESAKWVLSRKGKKQGWGAEIKVDAKVGLTLDDIRKLEEENEENGYGTPPDEAV